METSKLTREIVIERLRKTRERKAKAVEEAKQILTDICVRETGKAPTHFEVL